MSQSGSLDARRVTLSVVIGGHDATSAVAPYLTSFEYTDHATEKADEIQIELHDREGKWSGSWAPKKSTKISATLHCHDWTGPGQHMSLKCGTFTVDEVEYSGPAPDKVQIKAVTASLNTELRETDRSQAWENYTLEGLAEEVAGRNGLTLDYDAPEHTFTRQDQRGEPDLAFIQRLALDRGVNVKVHEDKLILFDAAKADAKGATLTISKTGEQFSPASYSLKTKSEGTSYSACTVEYHDPQTKQLRTYTYNPTGAELDESTTKSCNVDSRVESEADARRLAQSQLREGNKGEVTGSLELMGHPGIVAGMTINLKGFGEFDDKYFVEKASHKYCGGYKTSVEIRNTLEY